MSFVPAGNTRVVAASRAANAAASLSPASSGNATSHFPPVDVAGIALPIKAGAAAVLRQLPGSSGKNVTGLGAYKLIYRPSFFQAGKSSLTVTTIFRLELRLLRSSSNSHFSALRRASLQPSPQAHQVPGRPAGQRPPRSAISRWWFRVLCARDCLFLGFAVR